MTAIVTIGIDLAKNVFAVHGVDATGKPALVRPTVPRAELLELIASLPPCLIGMEACSGAHHWAPELQKFGHTVRLMAPKFVIPYRLSGKRGKNDAADAAAICEAITRPNMRFVPVKSTEQQGQLLVHRARQGFVEQRTATASLPTISPLRRVGSTFMTNRGPPTTQHADNSSGSKTAAYNVWRHGDADSMSAREIDDPTQDAGYTTACALPIGPQSIRILPLRGSPNRESLPLLGALFCPLAWAWRGDAPSCSCIERCWGLTCPGSMNRRAQWQRR
jgi:hypothetical protein